MGLVFLLLALPFLAGSIALFVWICRKLPAGWKRLVNGLTAACVIFPLAWFLWMGCVRRVTWAEYVCVECGRTEKQDRFFGWTFSRTRLDGGEDYQQRFPGSAGAGHEHDWHLESCLYSVGMVGCTMECVQGWFRVLPKLSDREAADALYREAQSLPRKQRCRLMDEVTAAVWYGGRDGGDVDAAFARWNANRLRQGSAPANPAPR